MSEAPPLLLNMGADVASVTGLSSMPGHTPAAGNQGNEFAGVLRSVLNPAPPQANATPLSGKQLEANPLLFVQAGSLANSLLPQVDMPLDAALTGKILPTDMPLDAVLTGKTLSTEESEPAWQTLLAEGESQDLHVPQAELIASEQQAYSQEELAGEDILPIHPAQATDKPASEELENIHSPEAGTNLLSTDKPTDTRNEPAAVSPTVMAALQGQDIPSVTKPAVTGGEQDILSKITRSQSAISKPTNPVQLDASSVDAEAQEVSHQLFQEKIQPLAATGKQDGLETISNKLESIMADSTGHLAVTKPASLTGISNYAAISGVGSSLPPALSTTPTIAHLTIPPQNPAWGDTVGNQVQWMAAQNVQEARIRLHPQDLGMLEVRIQVGSDQQTTISFSSPHAQVRDALETAMPRLREMFGETGLTLGDVNVSHHSSSEQGHADPDNKPASSSQSSHSHSSHEPTDVAAPHPIITQGNGMLDLYA